MGFSQPQSQPQAQPQTLGQKRRSNFGMRSHELALHEGLYSCFAHISGSKARRRRALIRSRCSKANKHSRLAQLLRHLTPLRQSGGQWEGPYPPQQMQNQQPQHLGRCLSRMTEACHLGPDLEGQSGSGLSKEWRLFSNPASLKHLELGKSSCILVDSTWDSDHHFSCLTDSFMFWIPRQAQHQQSNFQQFPQQPSNFQQFPQRLGSRASGYSTLERLRNFQGMGQQAHGNYNMQQGNMQQGSGGF